MKRQTVFEKWVAVLAVATATLSVAPTTSAFNLNVFGAGPSGNTESFVTPAAKLRDGFWAGAHLQFADAPLVCRNNVVVHAEVARLGIASAVAGFGLADGRFQLSFTAPFQAAQLNTTDDENALCPVAEPYGHLQFGLNDPVVSATYVFATSDTDGFSLSLSSDFGVAAASLVGALVPGTQEQMRFFGDRLGALSVSLNPGFRYGPLVVSSSVGAFFRPQTEVIGRTMGSGLTASVGVAGNFFLPRLFLVGDIYARTLHATQIPLLGSTETSGRIEAMGGFRYTLYGVTLGMGVGSTALAGPGSSSLRAMISIAFETGEPRESAPPILDLTTLFNQEVFIVEPDAPVERKRRRRKKRDPPCPDPATLSPEDRLFLPEGCEPDPTPEPDPYADKSFEEVMCADAIAAVCAGAGKLPPVVDRSAHFEFALGDSALTAANVARLQRIAKFTLPERKLQKVVIVGHADALGSDDDNAVLALARAQAVADVLLQAGIDESQMEVSARGEKDPLVDVFDTVAGAPSNRRVDLTIRYEVIVDTSEQDAEKAKAEQISVEPVVEEERPPARVPINLMPPIAEEPLAPPAPILPTGGVDDGSGEAGPSGGGEDVGNDTGNDEPKGEGPAESATAASPEQQPDRDDEKEATP